MKKRIFLILIAIVVLGGWLRFWQLTSHPVSLTIDELGVAYNSYSILKTGRDEHGRLLPLAFRSIGDYKAPLLVYLMTPSIAVFGLIEFAVRFPIALIGTLTIIFVFLLTQEITKNRIISLLTSFSFAISPWHLQFSRPAFEAVLALFLMIVGVWLFLRELRLKGRRWWLSAVFLSLAMYAYHAERLTVPVLLLGLALIFRKELFRYRESTGKTLLLGLIISLPLLYILLGTQGQTRLANAFISRDYFINRDLHQPGERLSFSQKIFDNNFLILFNFWLKRYLDYWDLRFLFFKGVKMTLPGAPDIGLFHLFEIIPFLLGIWLVFLKREVIKKKKKAFFTYWLLIGPLAASLANNPQHALRSLTAIPMPQILVGVGGFWLFGWLKKRNILQKIVISLIILTVFVVSLVYYFDIYCLHFPIHFSEFWDYGHEDLARYAWAHKEEYEEIIIDPRFGSEGPHTVRTPYLYVLFYGQYDPYLFQNSPRRRVKTEDSVDFENFTFREIYWPDDRKKKNTLFLGSPWVLPEEDIDPSQVLEEFYFKNGIVGFSAVKSVE